MLFSIRLMVIYGRLVDKIYLFIDRYLHISEKSRTFAIYKR